MVRQNPWRGICKAPCWEGDGSGKPSWGSEMRLGGGTPRVACLGSGLHSLLPGRVQGPALGSWPLTVGPMVAVTLEESISVPCTAGAVLGIVGLAEATS